MNSLLTVFLVYLILQTSNVLAGETKDVQVHTSGKKTDGEHRFTPFLKILKKMFIRDGSQECPDGYVYSYERGNCVLDVNSGTNVNSDGCCGNGLGK